MLFEMSVMQIQAVILLPLVEGTFIFKSKAF